MNKKDFTSQPAPPPSDGFASTIQRLEAQLQQTKRNEQILVDQIILIRKFYGITAKPSGTIDEKIQLVLQLGCEHFKLPIGILSHIQADQYKVLAVCSPQNMIPQGSLFSLDQTYCLNTIQSKNPIGFEHASQSGKWNTHPCFEAFKLEAYLGMRVFLNGQIYGTLNFSSLDPYDGKFSALDYDFLKIAAGWMGEVLAAQEEEDRSAQLHILLDSIVENLPGMVFVKDAKDLKFVRWNKAGEQLIGIPRETMIGKTDYDFFTKAQADFFIKIDREVLANKTLLDIPEEEVQTQHQGLRYLHTKKIPIFDQHHEPAFLLGLSEDITDRKHIEETLRIQQKALEHSPNGILITDATKPDNPIVYCNRNAEAITGYSFQELKGKNCRILQGEDRDQDEIDTIRKSVLQGKACQVELRNYKKNGALFWNHMSIAPVKDPKGDISHFVGVMVDITARKKAEESLHASEAQFRQLAEHIQEVFWLTDPRKTEMIYVSPAYETIWGRSRGESLQIPTILVNRYPP